MRIKTIPALFIIFSTCSYAQHVATDLAAQNAKESNKNLDAVIDYIRPILQTNGYSARLYFSGMCKDGETGGFVAFPQVEVQIPEKSSAIDMVQNIFKNQNILVTQHYDKLVAIQIGKPPATILQTTISSLKLSLTAQFNPAIGISAIEAAPEVNSAMVEQKIHIPEELFNILLQPPEHFSPHLPAVMENMTVDQILDSIALTFHGVVTYGVCTQSDGKTLMEIHFVGLE